MNRIEEATQAAINLLEQEGILTDDVIAIIDTYLHDVWQIEDGLMRALIIQNAGIEVGLLRADDID